MSQECLAQNPSLPPDLLNLLLRIILEFRADNPYLIQSIMPNPSELGTRRTDSNATIYEEMKSYSSVSRVIVQNKSETLPGISIVIGSTPAGSSHVPLRIPYKTFMEYHAAMGKTKLLFDESNSTLPVVIEQDPHFLNEEYYNFEAGFNEQKTLPLHVVVWVFLEIDHSNYKKIDLISIDLFDLAFSKETRDNPLKKYHLEELLIPRHLEDLFSTVMSEVDKQFKYQAKLFSKLHNEIIVPHLQIVLKKAFDKGILKYLPSLDELLINPQDVSALAAVGHDSETQFDTNRGPQSHKTAHFHGKIDFINKILIKSVSGRNDYNLSSEEYENFKLLMEMFEQLSIFNAKTKYIDIDTLNVVNLSKQIDLHGAIQGALFVDKLTPVLEQLINSVIPGKIFSITPYHDSAKENTLQAIQSSGWKIVVSNSTASEALASLKPIFKNWYDTQAIIFKIYTQMLIDPTLDLNEKLKNKVPDLIIPQIIQLLKDLKPTEAMLINIQKESSIPQPSVIEQHRRIKLNKLRRQIRLLLQSKSSKAENITLEKLVVEWQKLRLPNSNPQTYDSKTVLARLESGNRRNERAFKPHRIMQQRLISLLMDHLALGTERSANASRIPGFIISWKEIIDESGENSTEITLSLSLNQRGPVEVSGYGIERAEAIS